MKEDLYDDLLNEKEEKTDFQALFFKYIIHWPWFVASVLICTGLAFAYLRYQIPVYEVSSSILIKEDDKEKYQQCTVCHAGFWYAFHDQQL